MKKIFFIITLSFILLLGACAPTSKTPEVPATPLTPLMPTFDQTQVPKTGETIAIIETNMGTIKMKFFEAYAPETVKNFTELAKKNFYNGLIFHRVIPDFMIQGGDPDGTGMGGETYKGKNTTLNAEIVPELRHVHGAVSMARKGNDINSASSQFFVVQNKDGTPFLDQQYTVFGQVFEGLDVVDAIAKTARDPNDKPLKDVKMKKVTITKIP